MDKKGNVIKLTGFALVIVVLTLVIAIGLNVASTMRDLGRTTASDFDTNTTFVAINGSAVSFAQTTDYLTCSNVNIYNTTNLANVTGSFTISNCLATLKATGPDAINNTRVTANYTYTSYAYSKSYNATAQNISGISSIPGWLPVIIVAFIGGVVLFLVIKQFGG